MSDGADFLVFDRDLVALRRRRAQARFPDHDFLYLWARDQLCDRLQDVSRQFDTGLQIGARGAVSEHQKIGRLFIMDITPCPAWVKGACFVQGSEEFLPFARGSLDLVLSALALHSVNDLPGALVQIRQSLKPDGLFLACLLGGETLHELRRVMMEVELEMFGGVSPRVAPFADKPQMGDLLQRAGFALPVVDSDIVSVTYKDVFKLMHDLRGMGESNALIARNKQPAGRDFFMRVARRYHDLFAGDDGRIVASFEVIFLLGWAPHSSQQKPLRPGSAKHRLADALGGVELTTGEKAEP